MLPLVIVMSLAAAACAAQEPASGPGWQGEEITGMYRFLGSGEFVQISVQRLERNEDEKGEEEPADSGFRVRGFISRRGDSPSNRGAVLEHFFSEGHLRGAELGFTTRPVHGVWFEFAGRVERGTAAARTADGYLVLRGRLTRYQEDAEGNAGASHREVALPSLRVDPADLLNRPSSAPPPGARAN
jgi:hypothetical protein